MSISKISDHISNISYKDKLIDVSNKFFDPKIKNLVALALLNIYPANINNSNDNNLISSIDFATEIEEVITKDSTYEQDAYPDFNAIDLSGIKPNSFFTDKAISLQDSISNRNYYRAYDLTMQIDKIKDIVFDGKDDPSNKYPNKIRADLIMWYIDESYKSNYDKMQSIYNILWTNPTYRYPIFQKLNILFDNFATKKFGNKDIYIYDKIFYQLLNDKLLHNSEFRQNIMQYIYWYEKTYRSLQNKSHTRLNFSFNDSSDIKNYDIKFSDWYYTLPTRLDYKQVKEKLDKLWVSLYSSAEFDKAQWDRYGYYTISTHGMSPLVPEFLDYLQQDLRSMFPDLDIWGKDKLIMRGGTEYSHSDYFTSITKKTTKSNKKWSKPEVTTSRARNHLFDYKEGELADVKKAYRVDDNTIKWEYIDKIITKHQFGYSIDIQSRGAIWVAMSKYANVRSTAYNFADKSKIGIKQYWPDWHITALFSYHDNHFHIQILPTDLYHKIKGRLR